MTMGWNNWEIIDIVIGPILERVSLSKWSGNFPLSSDYIHDIYSYTLRWALEADTHANFTWKVCNNLISILSISTHLGGRQLKVVNEMYELPLIAMWKVTILLSI